MTYIANAQRYDMMPYRPCGKSGLKLPAVSLGLWHNFGFDSDFDNIQKMIWTAFDAGITHFDIADNYGPPPGSAESNFGKILKSDLAAYRDELIISTKAGYLMWAGPYGEWGSRKHLLAGLDQSLKRMGLDYVDIFYSHRLDPKTPLEETGGALIDAVRRGKALYVGVSNYPPDMANRMAEILRQAGITLLIHQPRYSILDQNIKKAGLLDCLDQLGVGCIPFSPLAQGLLTNKYLAGSIPADSRAAKETFLKSKMITPQLVASLNALNDIAQSRGQTLAQMAVAWLLSDRRITSVLIGASKPQQILDCVAAVKNTDFDDRQREQIDRIAAQ